MTTRTPAEVFPPGEFLREELDERGWTQADLAAIMARPVGTISEIIAGKRGITAETARGLAAALGTSPELWMNLAAAYQLSRVTQNDDDAIARRARIYAKAPVKEMIRRGWIEASDNPEVLESRVLRFFRIKRIEDEPELPLHAARKSTSYEEPLTPSQTAWLFRAAQLSHAVYAKPYSPKALDEALEHLKLLRQAPQEVRRIPRVLSDAGIKLLIVQPLPGNKIDGACFWRDGSPVIALSLRFDRIDNFWFVLMHELGHLRKGEMSFDVELEAFGEQDESLANEREANAFATEYLVPKQQLESFISRVRPLYSTTRVGAFAKTMQVHPAIVVGQLQHRGEIAYSSFRRLMEPVRQWIVPATVTDGWGVVLPPQL